MSWYRAAYFAQWSNTRQNLVKMLLRKDSNPYAKKKCFSGKGAKRSNTEAHYATPRPGSVVVERSPGMREVSGSIPGRVKQKTL